MPASHQVTEEQAAELFRLFENKAKSSCKGIPGTYQEDSQQNAALGIFVAAADHGANATPLQIQDGIREEHRQARKSENKNRPTKSCPVCGSNTVKECPHKREARKFGYDITDIEYQFGKTEHKFVRLQESSKADILDRQYNGSTGDGDLLESFVAHVGDGGFAWEDEFDQYLIEKLPDGLRGPYQLRLEGKSYRQIAQQLGMSRQSTRTIIEKARNQIKKFDSTEKRWSAEKGRVPGALRIVEHFKPVPDNYRSIMAAERAPIVSYSEAQRASPTLWSIAPASLKRKEASVSRIGSASKMTYPRSWDESRPETLAPTVHHERFRYESAILCGSNAMPARVHAFPRAAQ
jgi:hypothetical protein